MTTAANHDDHAVPLPDATIDAAPIRTYALIALAVGAVGFVGGGVANLATAGEHGVRDFFLTYLAGWVFVASLPIGAVGLSCLGFLTTASWGIVLRRTFQASIATLPLVAVLFLPILISVFIADGKQSPYWWADSNWAAASDVNTVSELTHLRPEAVEENKHKVHDYLNGPFFTVRYLIYFAFLIGVGRVFATWGRRSEEQDDAGAREQLKGAAGPIMICWALLTTFVITDWVMSLEPTWASSMFPVVFGMNAFITAMAFGALVTYTLVGDKPEIMGVIKDKFRIDLGSLLFGFTMVWAYASFSQYMLIWAGNLPEEITYYRKRTDHGWEWAAYALMLFHWLIPFVVFLFREVKTDPRKMKIMCTWLLAIAALDVCWWTIPTWPHTEGKLHLVMGLSAQLLVGGVWALAFAYFLGQKPILPANSETRFMATWGHHH